LRMIRSQPALVGAEGREHSRGARFAQ
jgi:hypothetical protein